MEYTRGSEWRRWDFHLHTPDTKKNDQFQANGKGKWELFYENIAGSIENITTTDSDTFLGSRGIQQHLCNILEGGKEAFIARKNKYTNL